METPSPNLRAHRKHNPILFWFGAVYNAMFFLGGIWIMVEIARGNVR